MEQLKRMRISYTLCFILAMGSFGCRQESDFIATPLPPPINVPEGYPHILKFIPERYNEFIDKWRHFLEAYNIPYFDPQIDSVLMVATSFPRINLFPGRLDTVKMEEAESALISFIYKWRDLLNIDASYNISAARREYDSYLRGYRFIFKKEFYDVNNFDYLFANISNRGELRIFMSAFAPVFPIPSKENVDLLRAVQTISGKVITYDCWTRVTLTINSDIIDKVQLVRILVPRWSSSRITSIEYRLCWKIDVQGPLSVYVDAITGKDIDYYEQHFIC